MNVDIQSVEENAVFKVVDPNRNAVAEGKKSWPGELPQTGNYQIVVGTERGGASYTLSVSSDENRDVLSKLVFVGTHCTPTNTVAAIIIY